jgi:hypothetical protein
MRSAALNRPGSRASSARPPPAPAPRSAGSSQGRDRRSLSRHVWRQATGVRRTLRAEARRWRPRAWRPVAPRLCFNSRRHDRLASVRDHDDITGLEVRRRVLEEAQVFAGCVVETVDGQRTSVSTGWRPSKTLRRSVEDAIAWTVSSRAIRKEWEPRTAATGLLKTEWEEICARALYGLVGSAALPCGFPHRPELLNPVC